MKRTDTVKKVLKYIGKYKFLLLLSIVLATITVVLTQYVPILVGKAIDGIIGVNNVKLNIVIKYLTIAVVVALITALLQWIMNSVNNKITFAIVRDLRNDAFNKIQHLPLAYLDSHPTGETVSKIITDADQLADGLLMGFTQLFSGICTILVTLGFMLWLNWAIALIVVVLTPLSLFIAKFIASKTYSMFKLQAQTRSELTAYIDENVSGAKVIKAFSREEKTVNKFGEINDRLNKTSLRATFFSSLTNPATRFVNSVVYACVALGGGIGALSGALTVGGLSCFLSYANQYTKPFNEISGVVTELQNALACAERVLDFINEEEEPADAHEVLSCGGKVDIDNVSFSYTKERPLIKDFNLAVETGKRVAIVGPTGCGKTTLINLLMRFYDVDSGSIKVQDTDIRNVTRHSLRKNYGMVLQETWLKAGTIRENIAFGNESATDEEIINAAKASHAHSFIKRLKDGYDTVIPENGGNLSQGQKQLLCIARIMLTKPEMLILDEATSSIDTRTEQKIQKAFTTLMNGRTSFVVAHRLSTIKNADVILVMKDGNIIQQGTHEELLASGGFYSQLYNSQFKQ